MIEKISNWIGENLKLPPGKRNAFKAFLFLMLVIPIVGLIVYSVRSSTTIIANGTEANKRNQVDITSKFLAERLARVKEVVSVTANRPILRDAIEKQNWELAKDSFAGLLDDYIFVNNAVVVDLNGNVLVDLTRGESSVGKNDADSEWFQGAVNRNEFYLSGVEKVGNNHVINGAIPIRPTNASQSYQIAILKIEIGSETLFRWIKPLHTGEGGAVFIVDQHGNVVAHPDYTADAEIINMSQDKAVIDVLAGHEGYGTYPADPNIKLKGYDQPHVAAYLPVENNWGILVSQATVFAFADQKEANKIIILNFTFILLFAIIGIWGVIKIIEIINLQKKREEVIMESIGDGMVAFDRNWNITNWNEAAHKLSGKSAQETIGKNLRDILRFYNEATREEDVAFMEQAIINGKAGFMQTHTVISQKDGKEIPVGGSSSPIFNNNGQITGAIITFRDISVEKEAGQVKSDFAYASHQLKTPITKTLWILESMRDENDLQKMKEKNDTAYKSAISVRKLTDQLLAISEIDQKMIIPKSENINLAVFLNDIIKTCRQTINMPECDDIEVEPVMATLAINSDSKLLRDALFEIIDNAIRYGKKGDKVKIKTTINKNDLLIAVENNGIGIPENQQSLTFVKFYRGNNFNTTDVPGAGVGLFIAKEYINLLGGKIWVKSEKDKITTFFVSLPIDRK